MTYLISSVCTLASPKRDRKIHFLYPIGTDETRLFTQQNVLDAKEDCDKQRGATLHSWEEVSAVPNSKNSFLSNVIKNIGNGSKAVFINTCISRARYIYFGGSL